MRVLLEVLVSALLSVLLSVLFSGLTTVLVRVPLRVLLGVPSISRFLLFCHFSSRCCDTCLRRCDHWARVVSYWSL